MTWVLFFDGDCGFCRKPVLKVHALDKKGQIDFAPSQGEFSKKMGYPNLAEKKGGTLVFLRECDNTSFFKGDAWIQLGKILGGFWAILAKAFGILRNWLYHFVAKHRYLLAGKGNTCALPSESLRPVITIPIPWTRGRRGATGGLARPLHGWKRMSFQNTFPDEGGQPLPQGERP